MRRSRLLIIVLLASLGSTAAWSQEGACGTPEEAKAKEQLALAAGYDVALGTMRKCLGDSKSDDSPLTRAQFATTPDTDSADARVEAIGKALARLRDAARLREQQGVDVAAWHEIAGELDAEVAATTRFLQEKNGGVHAIDEQFWKFEPNAQALIANGTVQPLKTGCTRPPAPCAVYTSRVDLVRVMNLMHALIGYADYANLQKHYDDAKLLDDQWNGYFNKALPQFWWEVAINGSRMGDDLCPKDSTGMQIGFCKVPQSQLIVLHPVAALQWVHGADDEDDLAAAFVVEIFGMNRWKWKNDAVLHGQFGWSVIAAYSNPGGTQENWSYGVMLHKGPSLNLGLTAANDGQYALLVSVTLAKKYFNKKAEYLDYLKALEKPSWESLL